MLNIACVKVGSEYGPHYVNTLFDMVRRNLDAKTEGRFVCFTDDPTGLDPGIIVKEVPPDLASRGWWAKLYLFSPQAFISGERVLYFDLDTAITGPLDAIAGYRGTFAILRDAYRPDGLQSSVMAWQAGWELSVIWSNWIDEGKPDIPGGDQAWIERCCNGWQSDLWQERFPGVFRSYKLECRTQIPRGTSVVFFHGHPRPHEVITGWVPHVWKVGGGSGLEFVVQANTSEETLRENVQYALQYPRWISPREPHQRVAVIVGGGPSLKETLFYIRGMQLSGCVVFATGNTYRYLAENWIQADAHVLLDARPENVEFVPNNSVPKLYASQCAPGVLDRAGADLIAWHAYQPCYNDLVANHPSGEVQIGGGTTVGLRTISLAYALGFREFRLFGFDSCYRESHHAYPQTLNDGERTIQAQVAGRTFTCAPWMMAQAEEFKELVGTLVSSGCMLSVYGDGMLQAITQQMSQQLTKIDNLYWPAQDQETRAAVFRSLEDLHRYIELCPRRDIAVQAGGNVGVFPKELAKHFTQVVTFEPDEINWKCLQLNVTEPNVVAKRAALGDVIGETAIEHNAFNPGASYLRPGEGVPITTIDSLRLDRCDLLQLDVEGYELKALKGAEHTIRSYSPLIVLELKGLGEKYGDTDAATVEWLSQRGYTQIGSAHRDVIFQRTH